MSGSPEAEQALVGALLQADDYRRGEHRADARRVLAELPPSSFADTRLEHVFRSMQSIADRDGPIDLVTVEHELKERGTLDDVGGLKTLTELLNFPYPDRLAEYSAIISENAAERERQEHDRHLRDRLEALGRRAGNREPVRDLLEAAAEIIESQEPAGPAAGVVTLREVLENPDYRERPTPAVPRIAWRGRVTLISAREKAGKSTLLAAALAAKSAGHRFLGEWCTPAPVLLLNLEEHADDAAARLLSFGADPDRVYFLNRLGADPFAALSAAIEESQAEVAVIDTLAAFVEHLELESGDAAGWTRAMRRLGDIARSTNVALLVLHHARKSDNAYRDSTAIGANVDMLIAMGTEEGRPRIRSFEGRGRWPFDDFTAELREAPSEDFSAYFELASRTLSVDAQVIAYLESNGGAGKRSIREKVRGRNADIDDAIHRLLSARAIEDRGSANRSEFHVVRDRAPLRGTLAPEEAHDGA